jgi:ferrous iron transport protein A
VFDLKPGEKAYIHSLEGNDKLVKRLMALGCIEGTEVTFKTKAPLGDPVVINFRGFDLAIRKCDAKNIKVKAV